jgi:hypothetical protein
MNDQATPSMLSPSLDRAVFLSISRKSFAFELDLLATDFRTLLADIENQTAEIRASERTIASIYPRSTHGNQLTVVKTVCAQAIQRCNQTSAALGGSNHPVAIAA